MTSPVQARIAADIGPPRNTRNGRVQHVLQVPPLWFWNPYLADILRGIFLIESGANPEKTVFRAIQ